ncbi:MAG: Rpn family recombination-promoting nuclease/putative transposase [Candidatus Riflebacteria bacterium]|nr:Rpn family recombination-promoting nuclease/putative transposase [Candidatus Riflebacteria bacterium]
MGKQDSITKQYMSDNEKFADIYNMYIYNGKQIIKPEDLQELDTSELVLPFSGKKLISVQRYRDIFKSLTLKTTGKAIYALVGIENQTHIHYAMPVRDMLYAALRYSKQVQDLAKQNRQKAADSSEFLSGISKEQKLIPVITLIVYFGTEPWDAPTSLKEMLCELDEVLDKYVQDYKIYVVSVHLPDKKIAKLQTGLREVFQFVKYSPDKKQLPNVLNKNKRFKKLDKETAFLIKAITNVDVSIDPEEEEVDMCQAVKDLIDDRTKEIQAEIIELEKANKKAREEGREEGEQVGMLKVLSGMVQDNVISLAEAAKRMKMTVAKFKNAAKKVAL